MYVTEDSGGAFWDTESNNWESANFSWEETNFDFVQPIDDREYKVQVLYAHSGGTATSTSAGASAESGGAKSGFDWLPVLFTWEYWKVYGCKSTLHRTFDYGS